MPATLEKMYRMGVFIEETFYPKVKKAGKTVELRGVFSDIGKKLEREGKTSVNLVRELRMV